MPDIRVICTDRDCPNNNVPVDVPIVEVAPYVLDWPDLRCTCGGRMYQIVDIEQARHALEHHPEALAALERSLDARGGVNDA